MKLLYMIAFLSMCTGIFLLLNITPISMYHDLQSIFLRLRPQKKLSMKKQIEQSTRKKKLRGIRKIFIESKTTLELTHRMDRLPIYTVTSIVLFIAAILISVLLGNFILMPILAVGLSLLPWLYILLTAAKFKKELNNELETALSVITTSYIRSNNLVTSFRENIEHINYPIRGIFEDFLFQSDMISSDFTQLLENMKGSLDNAVFQDWVDQLILCQDNRTLKSTLQSIVNKLSEVREVTGDLENLMYEPMKENLSMSALVVLNFPLIGLMNKEWYDTLMNTPIGQIIVAVTFAALFVSLIAAVQKTRPVEFRR